MPWSGTPPTETYGRDNGTYTGTTVWQQDESAAVGIEADRHDTHDQDIATALNLALKKDGGNQPTADIDWNGKGIYDLRYLGSETEASIASAGTTEVLGSTALFNSVTGTTTITSLGTGAERIKIVRFTGALTLTHNATSLILPGGANITTAAGDTMIVISDASSNARVLAYQKANGQSIAAGNYLLLAGGTMAGNLTLADNQIIRANLLDYGEVTNAIGGTGGGTQDIDLTLGNVVTATVDTSANTFTFSNPTASDEGCSFTLVLTNGGSQTVNWPASVDWAGGTAPTLTAAGVDILTFLTVDGGTIWYGFAAGLAMA